MHKVLLFVLISKMSWCIGTSTTLKKSSFNIKLSLFLHSKIVLVPIHQHFNFFIYQQIIIFPGNFFLNNNFKNNINLILAGKGRNFFNILTKYDYYRGFKTDILLNN